jgi:hypothetical protein
MFRVSKGSGENEEYDDCQVAKMEYRTAGVNGRYLSANLFLQQTCRVSILPCLARKASSRPVVSLGHDSRHLDPSANSSRELHIIRLQTLNLLRSEHHGPHGAAVSACR